MREFPPRWNLLPTPADKTGSPSDKQSIGRYLPVPVGLPGIALQSPMLSLVRHADVTLEARCFPFSGKELPDTDTSTPGPAQITLLIGDIGIYHLCDTHQNHLQDI